MSTPYYYKNPNTLTNQGTHNFTPLQHSRVVRSSNLTFGGYLAGTTPVLSVRFFLFVLCRCHCEHVLTMQLTVDFLASSVGPVCGNHEQCCKPQLTLPRQKSYMVLTRSMATTNNVQEDEPRPTALEKQVQILTAAVERLTKQNQVLEEQLHRKIGHNVVEDLEDSSAE